MNRREFLKLSGVAALGGAVWNMTSSVTRAQEIFTNPDLHVLNRITWGARPKDLARIREIGREAFIEEQLAPWKLEDPKIETFMAENPVLRGSEAEVRAAKDNDYGQLWRLVLWARLYRAIYSEWQLFERVVEVWNDHFNVPIPDYLSERIVMDRETIRPHALGKFRDLLLATAKDPAVLLYLNNASSNKSKPNENYARELLELHTLGVEGGYTEDDVQNVARAFTGWTLRNGWPGRFYFDINEHDTDEKVVLGQRMAAGRGIEDGLQVLDVLAVHPSTAKFISFKLCRHFVQDEPPVGLIESTATVFSQTEGDIRQVMRHILLSDAFMKAKGLKLRRPLELVAATFRTLDTSFRLDRPEFVRYRLEQLGQQPYMWFPPNGYPDVAEAWLNTNGMLHRWNLAMVLPLADRDWFEHGTIDLAALLPPESQTVGELIDSAAKRLLHLKLTPQDKDRLVYLVSDYGDAAQPVDAALRRERLPALLGLLLASPYFQWS